MINNYRWVSFNFGPTLLSWMEAHAPKILAAVREADQFSIHERGGHGNALAQVYNHVIMPLATTRDKRIQVHWGIEAFRYYFHRDPEGMWLPETAVDIETLEVLADAGMRFTVLSPRQARRVRKLGEDQWRDVDERTLDTRRAYRCMLPSGQEIALFFYDGEVAREVAFQRLLASGERFVDRVKTRFGPGSDEAQLVHIATDGETYGHHHRFGEMALAYFIDTIQREGAIQFTNYGQFLSLYPPQWDVEIVENSSWSCVHGIERWRADCGCKVSANPQVHQRWRAPLREGLTYLKRQVDEIYERDGAALFKEPWQAFAAYIDVVLHRDPDRSVAFLKEYAREGLNDDEQTRALMLLEMQRHGQLMFTSCAWFFDDISGLEAIQILKFAARAVQLAEGHFGASVEGEFLKILERAESNNPRYGNGRVIWEKEVKRAVVDLRRVVAHYAISSIFHDHLASTVLYQYEIERIDQKVFELGSAHLAVGFVEALSRITLEKTRQVYAAIHFGSLDFECYMKSLTTQEDYRALKQILIDVFYTSSLGEVSQRVQHLFSAERYYLSDLFLEEQRSIIELMLKERLDYYIAQFEKLSDQDAPLLYRLGSMGYPVPEPMRWAAFLSTEYRIRRGIETLGDSEDLWELRFIMQAARRWGYVPDPDRWQRHLIVCLEKEMEHILAGGPLAQGLRKAELIMKAAEQLEVPLQLWQVQNLFVEACEKRTAEFEQVKAETLSFAHRISLHPDVLPPSLR